jgi:hypothetical protein
MAISQLLAQTIQDMFANPTIAQEHVATLNASSNLVQAPRIAVASTPLSPTSDYRVLLNATSGSNAVSLPSGVNGQTFAVAYHPANTSTWTMTPAGSDVLAAPVTTAMSTKAPVNVQYLNGTWFGV